MNYPYYQLYMVRIGCVDSFSYSIPSCHCIIVPRFYMVSMLNSYIKFMFIHILDYFNCRTYQIQVLFSSEKSHRILNHWKSDQCVSYHVARKKPNGPFNFYLMQFPDFFVKSFFFQAFFFNSFSQILIYSGNFYSNNGP